ncbi:MAG TPA: hypothetical protein VEB21_01665 [Terriglobales bacterium]|nr:hypothetical protein [Terriglobales bacterium]
MQLRCGPEQGDSADEALTTILSSEPYLAYANFAPFRRRSGALQRLHHRRMRQAADGSGLFVARDAAGRPLAALALAPRLFDSAHFASRMARADAPVAVDGGERRLAVLRGLYRQAIEAMRAAGFQHLSFNCSSHDRAACWVLQELEAFYVGTKITWMQTLDGRARTQPIEKGLRLETYPADRLPLQPASCWQRLHRWSAQAFDRGPFVFDLSFTRERAMALYQVWTERAMTGQSGDVLLVVKNDSGEVVAFHSVMKLGDLSDAAGHGVLGRGIGGTLPEHRGLFTALQQECAATRPLGADFLENETQSSTVASIQVFGKLGHQCARSTATFHLRLDGGLRGRHPASAVLAGAA